MKLFIYAYDITGGWNLDEYDAQKGHKVQLYTNVPRSNIKSIAWDLGDGSSAVTSSVTHVFETQFQVPGEGYVTVQCTVVDHCGNTLKSERTLLLLPRVDCEMYFESYTIKNDTRQIDLVGELQCMPLGLGDPFSGLQSNACGGACLQDCPRCDLLLSELQGTNICEYGKHTIIAQSVVRCEKDPNSTCVELYQNNAFGRHGRYPPVVREVCVVPDAKQLKLLVTKGSCGCYCAGPNKNRPFHRTLTIDGLSAYMLPKDARIEWFISNGEQTWRARTKKKFLQWGFERWGNYTLRTCVVLACCEPIKVTAWVAICPNACDDIVTHPVYEEEPVEVEVAPDDQEQQEVPVPVPVPAPV